MKNTLKQLAAFRLVSLFLIGHFPINNIFMKIYLMVIIFFGNVFCAIGQEKTSKYHLVSYLGYGTENNYGNTAFFFGIGINKNLLPKVSVETSLTYFTTGIYNVYKDKPTFYLNAQRWYNSLFFNVNLQYLFGNENSLINAKLKAGPALKYYDYKMLRRALVYNSPIDGLYPIVPGTEVYYRGEGVNVSLYTGFSLDAKINKNLRLGVFLDTYSNSIPLEHFMPGVSATFKIR
jgi:hypothetical protein